MGIETLIAIGVVCATILTLVLIFKDRLLELFFNISPKDGSIGGGLKMTPPKKDPNLIDDVYDVDMSGATFGGKRNKFSVESDSFKGQELKLEGEENEIRFGEGKRPAPPEAPDAPASPNSPEPPQG